MRCDRAPASLLVFFLPLVSVSADPPPSAYVHVANSNGVGGACYLNSAGQLVSFREPSFTTPDIVVRSGIATQVGFGQWRGGGLANHPRGYAQGVALDLCRLSCASFRIGYGKGGAYGRELLKAADAVTIFASEAEAVRALKNQVAAGNPVQVHIDMYYTWEAGRAAYPSQDFGPAVHGSHNGIVNGYDADYVYVTDSGPTYGPGETGEDIPVPWDDFLAAWRETPNLTSIREFWFGPYGMLYLTSDPVRIADAWAIAWLGLDAVQPVGDLITGPDSFRYAADAIRGGRTLSSVFPGLTPGVMIGSRERAAQYFCAVGRPDIAAKYRASSAMVLDMLLEGDSPEVPAILEELADLDEQAIALMQGVAAGVSPLLAAAPPDGTHLRRLGELALHWVYLPHMQKPWVEIAMRGDFADKKNLRVWRPKKGNRFVRLTPRDWRRLLPKDGGDRSLSWRVLGRTPNGLVASEPATLTWGAQSCAPIAPADGYAAGAGELVRLEWEAPPVALKPVVAISAARRLRAKDDEDGIVYWRIEDASKKTTTVAPSEARALLLPE
ncbi:MAG: hypothetical protein ACUVYA_07435 [Planctomycetota bacterium]